MYVLDRSTQSRIIAALVEGNSIRATSRMTGAAKNTIQSLLMRLGAACQAHHDQAVQHLPPRCAAFQADEIHTFCYARKQNLPANLRGVPGYGDVWTWTAICDTTRLIAAWHMGGHAADDAEILIRDLTSRCAHPFQLTTDGAMSYRTGHLRAGAEGSSIAMMKKRFKDAPSDDPQRRYAPPKCLGVELIKVIGEPDLSRASTSYAERHNLTMRMGMRRFTRLTNGFSKDVAHLKAAMALHVAYYNWVRIHQTLRVTPAMAAGLTPRLWSLDDLVGLLQESNVTSLTGHTSEKV